MIIIEDMELWPFALSTKLWSRIRYIELKLKKTDVSAADVWAKFRTSDLTVVHNLIRAYTGTDFSDYVYILKPLKCQVTGKRTCVQIYQDKRHIIKNTWVICLFICFRMYQEQL
jgi:hypothetical protein